jgi:hypothetical protein
MAKLVKIAETKDVTPGQAGAFDVEGQKIALWPTTEVIPISKIIQIILAR